MSFKKPSIDKTVKWILLFIQIILIVFLSLDKKIDVTVMQAFTGEVLQSPPSGPILIITSPDSTFGAYYGEILRNEGFNEYSMLDISKVNKNTLAAFDVVILAKMLLTPRQVTLFSRWVIRGGNLIAMTPDAGLAPLLGLIATGDSLNESYLRINTSGSPGAGLVDQTIQFHGRAELYTLNGAANVATLYRSATQMTKNPAVSLRSIGRGTASAFSYDLATSVIYTRQGNPDWVSQERDGLAPIRANDMFFGDLSADKQPDWIDKNKIAIPQADEQQRLFANLILHVNNNKRPLPRFWYFPHGKKAIVMMTGDDHGMGGTKGRFDQLEAASDPACSVADWECIRGTSYIFTSTPLSNAEATLYNNKGYEIGIHINTGCKDYTLPSLQSSYSKQLSEFLVKYTAIPRPTTQRHHCIAWSDWVSAAQVELANGMRLDTNYYYWPSSWVADVPGNFTGSAMPMRFSTLNGELINVYQVVTQMTDESGQSYPFTVDALLDRALGPEGYYGVYTINAHTDKAITPESTAVIASAKARNVPVVSSQQMLNWLDGRNASTFGAITWENSTLRFTIATGANSNGIQAMLPFRFGKSVLKSIMHDNRTEGFNVKSIKGIDYAFFSAQGGNYSVSYDLDK